jgi:hypothetical protein
MPKFWRSSSVADASVWIIVQQKLKISVKNSHLKHNHPAAGDKYSW